MGRRTWRQQSDLRTSTDQATQAFPFYLTDTLATLAHMGLSSISLERHANNSGTSFP